MGRFFKNLSIRFKVWIMMGFFLLDLVVGFVFFSIVLSGMVRQVQARITMETTYAGYLTAQIDLNNYVVIQDPMKVGEFEKNMTLIAQNSEQISKDIQQLGIDLPELEKLPELSKQYHKLFQNFVQKEKTKENQTLFIDQSNKVEKQVTQIFEKLKKQFNEVVFSRMKKVVGTVTVVFSITFLISLLFGWLVLRSITVPVQVMLERFSAISGKKEQGEEMDLSVHIQVEHQDELGKMALLVNGFLSRLNRDFRKLGQIIKETENSGMSMVRSAQEETREIQNIENSMKHISENVEDQTSGVEQVSSTLEEMVRNIDHIATNIEKQAASVNESAGTIEEMSRNIEHITKNSVKTKETSKQLSLVARDGGDAVKKSMFAIREVAEYSNQILKLLKLITDIARQTNLLAMNASIEAAHAGDAGKGFAIVADEIRRLSENTNKSAREIQGVVNTIVEKIDVSANLSERAEMGLEKIVSFAAQTETIIVELNMMMEEQNVSTKDILNSTQTLVQLTEEIRLAMSEQKYGVDEFGVTMNNLKDLFVESRDEINQHLAGVDHLVQLVSQTETVIQQNQLQMMEMSALLHQFKLAQGTKSSETGLKLVE